MNKHTRAQLCATLWMTDVPNLQSFLCGPPHMLDISK